LLIFYFNIIDVEFNEVYDLDFEDFEWLQKLNKSPKKVTEDQFENLITQFEGLVKDKKVIILINQYLSQDLYFEEKK